MVRIGSFSLSHSYGRLGYQKALFINLRRKALRLIRGTLCHWDSQQSRPGEQHCRRCCPTDYSSTHRRWDEVSSSRKKQFFDRNNFLSSGSWPYNTCSLMTSLKSMGKIWLKWSMRPKSTSAHVNITVWMSRRVRATSSLHGAYITVFISVVLDHFIS